MSREPGRRSLSSDDLHTRCKEHKSVFQAVKKNTGDMDKGSLGDANRGPSPADLPRRCCPGTWRRTGLTLVLAGKGARECRQRCPDEIS